MKIKVEHEVPYDKGKETKCVYADGDFWGETVCGYHVLRNRHHGRKAPIEYNRPKCTLFNVWLGEAYNKCSACLAKCTENGGAEDEKGSKT